MITAAGGAVRVAGWARDAVLAVVTTVLLVAVSAHIPPGAGQRAMDAAGYALLVLAGLSMLVAAAIWILVPLAIGVTRVSRTEVRST